MIKKYELTEEVKVHMGKKLYRIRALIDIEKYNVKAGDLGGWIEKEDNLRHSGACWVSGNARVYGNAVVAGDAWVYDNADISGRAVVYNNARVIENGVVKGCAQIYGDAEVYDDAVVGDHAHICGDAWISDNAYIARNAVIKKDSDYLYINGLGEDKEALTVFRCADKHIGIKSGHFVETLEDFKIRNEKNRGGKYREEYLKFVELAEIYFGGVNSDE